MPGSGPEPSGPYASATARASLLERRLLRVSGQELEDALHDSAPLRRRGSDGSPAGAQLERRHLEHPVRAKVVRVLGDETSHHRRAVVADGFERLAGIPRVNTRRIAVDAPAAVVALEDPLEDQVQRLALLVALEARLGEANRRLDEVRPGAGREAAVDLLEARQEARHRDGAVADVEHLRAGIAEVDDELLHLAEPRCRDAEEAVEHRGGAARLVDEREAASGRAGQRALP